MPARRAFTLIELLIVVAIIAILAAIAVPNFQLANDRALKARGASNLRTVFGALAMYRIDHNRFPPADREAGPFPSHMRTFAATGNGPAGGGSWDGVPWLLLEQGYLTDPQVLFSPRYMKLYAGGSTLRGGQPRYHNFRYAYNAAAAASGGATVVESGTVWIIRDLWVGPDRGFYAASAPRYPADYSFPWGEGDASKTLEQAVYADGAVRTVLGGTDIRKD